MSNIPVKTGAGATANVSTTTLPDQTVAINHVTVNPDGSVVSPAQDATLQGILTQLTTVTAAFTGLVKTDPGTF